jgi:hypothetical protein
MTCELTEFRQDVFSGRLSWQDRELFGDAEKFGRRFLIQEPSIPPPRPHAPLREWPGLFRTFADLEISEAGVESFAREYGLLGSPVSQPSTDCYKAKASNFGGARSPPYDVSLRNRRQSKLRTRMCCKATSTGETAKMLFFTRVMNSAADSFPRLPLRRTGLKYLPGSPAATFWRLQSGSCKMRSTRNCETRRWALNCYGRTHD